MGKCFPEEAQGALQHKPFTVAGHWKRDHFLETQNQEIGRRTSSHSRYKSLKGDELFEENFGKARPQTIACDASIQTEDVSEEVGQRDAHAFRAVIGTLLYLARDRPDLLFVVKELSSAMSRPTLTAISRLRKVIGYLKTTSDFCMVLEKPIGGQGKWKSSERFWMIGTFASVPRSPPPSPPVPPSAKRPPFGKGLRYLRRELKVPSPKGAPRLPQKW